MYVLGATSAEGDPGGQSCRNQRASGLAGISDRDVPRGFPAGLGQAGEQHQIERIALAVGAPTKIVSEQEHRLLPRDRQAKLHHDALVRQRLPRDWTQRYNTPPPQHD